VSRSSRRTRYTLLVAIATMSPLVGVLRAQQQTPAAGAEAARAPRVLGLEDLLDIRTTTLSTLSDDGRYAVALMARPRSSMGMDYNRNFGDPTYAAPQRRDAWVIDTRSGERIRLFPESRVIGGTAWSPDASVLAVLVQRQDDRFDVVLWDRATRRTRTLPVPAGRYAFAGSDLRWNADGSAVLLAVRSEAWRAKAAAEFARLTTGPRVVQSSTEPFLAWNGLQRLGAVESVVRIDRRSGALSEVLPEGMRQQWQLTRDGQLVVYTEDITKKTDYDVIGGTEQQLWVRPAAGGPPTLLFASLRNIRPVWDRDGRRYAFTRDDQLFVGTLGDSARIRIAGDTTPRSDTSSAARTRRTRERFTPVAWIGTGALVATNRDGVWLLSTTSRERTMIVASSDSVPSTPRVRYVGAVQNEQQLLMTMESRTAWERAMLRYDIGSRRLDTLPTDSRIIGASTVSTDGSTLVVSAGAGNRPADLYALQGNFTTWQRLTDANPALAQTSLGQTELLQWLDADGAREFGVVHYPANYVKGQRYPTVMLIYEDFFNDTWDATANLLNANGYVVVKPSVRFDVGFPGEAWVKSVTAAANKVIELGIADSTRLGVHGTSYGGYATNLLITQTARFKAAINISGKVDMVSFYTDSPRLGVRNTHAAEKSQDRLGATLWQQPQKYIAHSAVMFADRISTPLLLMTGEQDHNVPAINTREMYYALRRLGKEVTWVTYTNGGHGVPLSSMDDWTDFHTRLLGWYAQHLKKATP
jgi:dipeptidyl aminopeptidase/acylaminoacyl peptidase